MSRKKSVRRRGNPDFVRIDYDVSRVVGEPFKEYIERNVKNGGTILEEALILWLESRNLWPPKGIYNGDKPNRKDHPT